MDYFVQPWRHQLDAIHRAATKDEFGLFFEVGAGKTSTCINILRYKYLKHNKLLKTLVLCPPIVVENWRKEFFQHSAVGSKVLCLLGPGKKRAETIHKNMNEQKIIVTNYEALLMKPVFEALMLYAPECLVVDESQRVKSMQARRTKATIILADKAKYRYILSGTPILNSPMDIFAQFRVLDRGETFGKNMFIFRAKYFYDRNAAMPRDRYFPDWQIRSGALEELNDLISKKSMRVLKKDCLDLPELVNKTIYVDLCGEQARLYQQLKRDLVAYVGEKACVAQLALTKALRLLQITSGFIVTEGENGANRESAHFKENPKISALKELLVDLAPYHKVILWSVFSQEYVALRKLLGDLKLDYVEVTGEVSQKEKMDALGRFAEDENCRVLLGNPSAAGVGINITCASYAIFVSRTFSLEHYLQAQARNYRAGSEAHEKITHIHLVAKDTIDEQVVLALSNKENIADKILDFIRKA